MLDYLNKKGATPDSLVWTLDQNSQPLYILLPQGSHAQLGFAKLMKLFQRQLDNGVELVAVAGSIVGSARLLSGAELPIVAPHTGGTFPFSTDEMLLKVLGPPSREPGMKQTIYDQKMAMVNHFLDTIFYQLQSRGETPEERAMNFAALHAFKIKEAFEKAHGDRLVLENIVAKQQPFSPPGSNRWEVMLTYVASTPAARLRESSRIYSFTVDVAPVILVMVGKITERHLN